MALRVAVSNGNWSNPSTWNAGLIPTAGDIAASNGYTVTIDVNINVDSITNTAASPVKITPNMTGYTTPSGIVEASSYNSGRPAWQAFDGNNGTIGQLTSLNGWISYQFTGLKIINAYSWVTGASENPQNWTFEGWDGASWIVLHTVTGGPANSYTSPLIGNNTAYIKYRINVTQTNTGQTLWYDINLFEKGSDLAAVAGGTFNLNSGVTVTCTGASGISAGNVTCMTYSGQGVSTINANIIGATTTNVTTLIHSGTGVLTINGNINGASATANTTVSISTNGVLNINGNIISLSGNPTNVNALSINNPNAIVNIVGDVSGSGTQKQVITLTTGTLNITGNIFVYNTIANSINAINTSAGTLNITGTLSMSNIQGGADLVSYCLSNGSSCTATITGNIIGDINVSSTRQSFCVTNNGYINHIGFISAGRLYPSYISSPSTAINILTGPFISYNTGILPLYITRMNYRRTSGSYYEFRDNSTNGALPPAAPAPATSLVAPSTVVDAPSPSNVRYGIVYASGSLTGTMRVPSASNVRLGIGVDNTIGTAALSVSDIWGVLLPNLTGSNTIGARLKNVSTVDSTGAQLTSFKSV